MLLLVILLTSGSVTGIACPDIVSVQASSQTGNWNPENLLNTAHGTYWMSEVNGNQDEWARFEFAEPAVVGSAEIRYNNGRQGSGPKIQGSNDAISWDDLAEVEPWDWPTDSDNFRKGVVDLPDWATTYKYFRYHSGPTVYVLLNHITFECAVPQPQIPVPPAPTSPGCWIFLPTCASGSVNDITQWFSYDSEMADVFEQRCIDAKAEFDTDCGGNADALTHYVEDNTNACPDVQSVEASSQTGNWNPDNLLNLAHGTYWMSEVNANQNEWVRFEFMEPTLVSSLKVRLNNGRQGSGPKIQGSQDGLSWDDLASVNSWQWPNDQENFRYGIIELDAPAYKFFRYHSGPTVYVLINHIKFQCASLPNNLKLSVKDAFDVVKTTVTDTFGEEFQRKFALPALIRKAFHDAGHFDQESGEMRLGCIQHFLSGPQACPQHAHFEKAEDFRVEVESMLMAENMQYSLADVVQLLGALAVDELAQGTGADLLYPKMKIGRTDVSQENCEADQAEMCPRLPDFHDSTGNNGHSGCQSGDTCHPKVEDALNAVWEHQIEAKMMGMNSLSKEDAVSLIGAHTVGHHFGFGAWVTNPMVFDNDYWKQLQKLKQHLDSGGKFGQDQNHVYSQIIFNDWFQDADLIDNPAELDEFEGNFGFGGKIMMLDSDLTLVLNAPELVELYADEPLTWRQHFDAAYVKMGELGITDGLTNPDAGIEAEITVGSFPRASKRSRNADDEYEFFQNLNLLREKQLSRAHEFHAQAKEAKAINEEIRKSMESTSIISTDAPHAIKVFAVIGLVSFGYFAFSGLRSCFVKQNYKYIADPETLEC